MPRTPSALSSARHFAVTWGMPDDFGGMTSVLLRRSAAFARAGAPVTVLTFDNRLDTAEIAATLRDRGALEPGVHLLHLWDWLAEHPLSPSASVGDRPFAPIAEKTTRDETEHVVDTSLSGVVRRRERLAADGTVLQVDRYRPDGSLLASDLRDVDTPGVRGGRSIVVCDAGGHPVRGWTTVWALYRHWFDRLTAKKPSVLIVDSKTAARFVRGYSRDHVATIHVVHSAHRSGDGEPGRPLKASRREVLERAAEFDAVVTLTERQRSELAADLGPEVRLAVVPNACGVDRLNDAPLERPADRGVVLASLTRRKRLQHALIASAAAGTPLDIYGEGTERRALEQKIAEIGAPGLELRGHRADAALVFREASFSLLTSTSEGAPLVIVESMAAGCIPIAYDIRYGPGDMIRDGVDGFVVAPGDTEQLADRIREFVGMPDQRRQRMRRAARKAASQYRDDAVLARWEALIADIARHRGWNPSTSDRARSFAGRVRRGVRRRLG